VIYFCLPSRDEATTVGLVLWKIRQVLTDTPREYQFLVGDDGSIDETSAILGPYAQVLPLTVFRNEKPQGYAATVERLLKEALNRSDRHKRDVAVLLPADFTFDPVDLTEILKRLDSGADLVIGEATLIGEPDRWRRLIRRWAPAILGRRARVAGVRDVVSGVAAIRLVALRQAFRERPDRWLNTEGWAANAELLSWAATGSRRIEGVPVTENAGRRQRPSRFEPATLARQLWRSRRLLTSPPQSGDTNLPSKSARTREAT
jgi:glycosyltransferase involved in cell wall biosynthesis